MKTIKGIILLTILALSFTFIGCDQLAGNKKSEPEITKKTFSDADRYDKNYPKDDMGEPLFPEGTTIEFKKVEEEEKTTTDYTATLLNGTETVFHEVEESKENHSGKITTTVTSKLETTFSETDTSGKKTEVVETSVTDEFATTKGEVKEIKTTTEFKDGSKEVSIKNTEGLTGYFTTSKESFDKDGNKTASEEIEHNEIDAALHQTTPDGIPLSSTEESVKITYDAQGKEATKIVTETTNPGPNNFFNKQVQVEYNIVNGEPVEAKRTEHLMYGCDELKVTEPQTDGSKNITITVKNTEGTTSLGEGSGTTDKNGVTTITIKYTNGIDLTTVEDGDTVTKEIYVKKYNDKCYYEKTVTEKGVLISKECEYLYDKSAGIVFKTVTTYSNGTETRKSGRFIKDASLSPAYYTEKYVTIPGNDAIYDRTTDIEIYADGNNAESYTTFTTKAWNGPKGDYDIIDYPFDSSVDMTNLHLLSAE